MSKTTNYEISKKLSEIGFNKETNFYYRKTDKELFINTPPNLKDPEEFFLKSYDLETLLDALPKSIMGPDDSSPDFLTLTKEYISYESYFTRDIQVDLELNEALADTAGRMIILLHKQNLIKF